MVATPALAASSAKSKVQEQPLIFGMGERTFRKRASDVRDPAEKPRNELSRGGGKKDGKKFGDFQ